MRASFTKLHPCVIDTKGVIRANPNRQLVFWTCGIGIVMCCVFFYGSLSAAICVRDSCLIRLVFCEPPNLSFVLFFLTYLMFLPGGPHMPDLYVFTTIPTSDNNWQCTISRCCDSRHLCRRIKLSDTFPRYCTTPCQGVEGRIKRQKVCHDKCYAPQNETAVYVWRKGSKLSLFTRVQVV